MSTVKTGSSSFDSPEQNKLIPSEVMKGKSILVAEDSLDNQYLIRAYFKSFDINLTMVETGLQVYLKQNRSDMI